MSSNLFIRLYGTRNRLAVRQICCETADRGGPVEKFFSDRKIFADLLTCYYTDFEPQSLWVALKDDAVIGYLMGCLDTRRYMNVMAFYIVPKTIIVSIFRGVFFRRETWRILKAMLKSCQMGGFRRNIPLDSYPVHLHVNVKQGFRGQGIGRNLVEKFFAQVRERGLKGIHLAVREDNESARQFFESLGFVMLSSHQMAIPDGQTLKFGRTLVYGKIL